MKKSSLFLFGFLCLLGLIIALWVSRLLLFNSDQASSVLIAKDLFSGNWLLKGWSLPADNFVTTDIIFYWPAFLWKGVAVSTLRISASFIILLIIIGTLWVSGFNLKKPERAWLTAFFFITFPSLYYLENMMLIPAHTGTSIFVLLSFLCVLWWQQGKKAVVPSLILLGGVSFFALLGDPLYLAAAVVPIMAWCGWRGYRTQQLSYIQPVVALLFALGLAHSATNFIQAQGAQLIAQPYIIAQVSQMVTNAELLLTLLFQAYGVDVFNRTLLTISTFVMVVSLVKIGVLAWCSRHIRIGWKKYENDTVVVLGSFAILSLLGSFVFSSYPEGAAAIRYLFVFFVISAVVGARVLSQTKVGSKLTYVAAILALFFVVVMMRDIQTAPSAPDPLASLQASSQGMKLKSGYGSYWNAAVTTVYSKQVITVAPIKVIDGRMYPYYWLSSAHWYHIPAYFVIYSNSEAADFYTPAVVTFGVPTQTISLSDNRTVLVWNHDISKDLAHYQNLEPN